MRPCEGIGRTVVVGKRVSGPVIFYSISIVRSKLVLPITVAVGVRICTLHTTECTGGISIRLLAFDVSAVVIRVILIFLVPRQCEIGVEFCNAQKSKPLLFKSTSNHRMLDCIFNKRLFLFFRTNA